MFFYSFIVYLFLFALRYVRNQTLYPHIEKSISEASRKKREEIRRKRSEEAARMAEKMQ
jgi:hypothetical protein